MWDANKYLWIRYIVTYINPEGTEYTTPFCDASWEAINNIKISGVNLLDGTKYDALEIGTFPETGSLTGKTYYTRSYAIYEDKDGNTYQTLGSIQNFVMADPAMSEE